MKIAYVLATIIGVSVAYPAHAGIYADDFGKCLVASSTEADRNDLMQWMFAAIAKDPRIAPHANISAETREKIDRRMAAVFERLVGDACRTQASEAIKYEGAAAFSTAFEILGRVAGQELFTSPHVAAGADFSRHIDYVALERKLGVALKP